MLEALDLPFLPAAVGPGFEGDRKDRMGVNEVHSNMEVHDVEAQGEP